MAFFSITSSDDYYCPTYLYKVSLQHVNTANDNVSRVRPEWHGIKPDFVENVFWGRVLGSGASSCFGDGCFIATFSPEVAPSVRSTSWTSVRFRRGRAGCGRRSILLKGTDKMRRATSTRTEARLTTPHLIPTSGAGVHGWPVSVRRRRQWPKSMWVAPGAGRKAGARL